MIDGKKLEVHLREVIIRYLQHTELANSMEPVVQLLKKFRTFYGT
jgi:hypothetical protein